MMLSCEAAAAAVYLLPVLLGVLALRVARKGLMEVALWIPVLVTLDLVALCVVSLLRPLAEAAFLVRAMEIAGFVVVCLRVRVRSDVPAGKLVPRYASPMGFALATAGLAIAAYFTTSHTLNIWDRNWHAPLVPSIEWQTFPFANVYEPGSRLHYHFSGDFLAACLRAYSFDALTSASALSLSHDLFIGLSAGWLALFLLGVGRSRLTAMLCGLGLSLHGCIPRSLSGDHDGYAFHLFTKLTYRPHVPCALFALTVLAALVGFLSRPREAKKPLSPKLVSFALSSSIFLGGLSDESSVILFLCGMGAAWVLVYRVFGKTRLGGLRRLFAMGATFLVAVVFVTGSLSSQGVVTKSVWHAPRLASVLFRGELSLSEASNVLVLLIVCAPPIVLLAAIATFAVQSKRASVREGAARDARPFGAVVFGGTVLVLSLFLGTCLTVNGIANESQRFFVAPFIANLVVAAVLYDEMAGVLRGVILACLLAPAAHSLYFLRLQLREEDASSRMGPSVPTWRDDLYRLDCRAEAGARFGERPVPRYLDEEAFMTFASCRPTYLPGARAVQWPLKVYPLLVSSDQLRDAHTRESGVAICRADGLNDVFCKRLLTKGGCTPEGRRFLRCAFSPSDVR